MRASARSVLASAVTPARWRVTSAASAARSPGYHEPATAALRTDKGFSLDIYTPGGRPLPEACDSARNCHKRVRAPALPRLQSRHHAPGALPPGPCPLKGNGEAHAEKDGDVPPV